MSLADLVKPHIRELAPYQPGKPPEELERELGIRNAIKLASNESPLGPSPRAVAALREALDSVHRYPDGACFALRTRLAAHLGVEGEQLVFGCGADELLELVAKAFLGAGDEAVFAWPSFAMYPIVVKGMGATPVSVPLDTDLVHDLDAMRAAITPRTRVVFVCNPNNPTGSSVGAAAFDAFVAALPDDVVLVVDEAYREFVRREDFPDSLGWLARRPATVVMRTFSKLYGLAGLRVGYGVASAEMADYLNRARHPFNVNRLAEVAALAALDDEEHATRARALNAEGAEFLTRELRGLGFEVWPTDANFVLVRAGEGSFEALQREGVIVRPLAGFGMADCVRVSIGLPEENRRLVDTWTRLQAGERRVSAPFERLCVVGLGLLGGSVAWAARERGVVREVVGATRSAEARAEALAHGAVDRVEALPDAARGADLVVLATPIAAMGAVLRQLAPGLAPGCIVTDVGSVKAPLLETLPGLLPSGCIYVGSHPMAGSHARGMDHARADLLEGAVCVVTDAPASPAGAAEEPSGAAAVERVASFWQALGARVVLRPADQHDAEVAWVSHLPHLLAFAFAQALAEAPAGAAELVGSGFRDFTRIARSEPELWADILSTNRKALAAPLGAAGTALRELGQALEAGDAEALNRLLSAARSALFPATGPSGPASSPQPEPAVGRGTPRRKRDDS